VSDSLPILGTLGFYVLAIVLWAGAVITGWMPLGWASVAACGLSFGCMVYGIVQVCRGPR
jgi:hypothetical protein